MSFRINTNTNALFANVYGRQTQAKLDSSLEKLSTGLRINRAADDAAGMQIANQLRSQSQGLLQGNKNAQDAIGLVKIADGALDEYQKLLVTARDKSLQAASDTNSDEARAALEEDVKLLMEQADKIATETQFNGINLLDDSFTGKKFQVGSESGQTISMTIADSKIATLGVADGDIDLTTQAGADTAVQSFDAAIKTLDSIRSGIGSTQLSLESRIRVNEATQVNVAAAESQIRDVDYASEQEKLTKNNIKMQANTYALQQSFQNQQLVLGLLR
jgi:flagellin